MLANIFKNMRSLAAGVALSKLAGIAAMPVLAHLYSPADFGFSAVFISLVAIASPLANLRYATVIAVPRIEAKAEALLAGALCMTAASVLLLTLICVAVYPFSAKIGAVAPLGPYIFMIPLAVLLNSYLEAVTAWSVRTKDFRSMSRSLITQSVISAATKIAVGVINPSPVGLVLGYLLQPASGIISVWRPVPSLLGNLKHRRARLKIVSQLRRHSGCVKFRLPSQLVFGLASQLPIILIAHLYDTSSSGQFSLAMMAISVPLNILGQTTSRAFFAEIARERKSHAERAEVPRLLARISGTLMLVGVPACVISYLAIPPLFSYFFGHEWVLAGTLASILVFSSVLQFVSAPTMSIYDAMSKQRIALMLHIFRLILVLATFALSVLLDFSVVQCITLYTVSMSLFYTSAIFITLIVSWDHYGGDR